MAEAVVPKVKIGSIGGSGTWGTRFPEDLDREDARVLEYIDPIETPYGTSCSLKLLDVGGQQVLRAAMHGWNRDAAGGWTPTWTCALQLAWIFQEAGVEWALVDGSVGGIQSPDDRGGPLPPWSVMITDDFIQYWVPPTTARFRARGSGAGRMREPFCAGLRQHLLSASRRQPRFTVYDGGVYVCTPPGRFETAAEIRMMARWGGHIVGQTLGHEAPLMRRLGIHFASLNIVSNYAEGNDAWIGENASAMERFYRDCARPVGHAIIDAVFSAVSRGIGDCHCADFRLAGLGQFPVDGA